MDSLQTTARKLGLLYFVFSLLAIVGEFLFPAFVVPGDATATARAIMAAELTYRLGILTAFVTNLLFIFLVVGLYQLFASIDRRQAMLMVVFVVMGVTISLVNLLNKMAPLILLSGADYLSVLTKPQLDALALGFLRLHGSGVTIATAFWGLWLLPFGALVIRSRFFPRFLGVLLMIAGFAYVVSSFASIALPAYKQVVSQFMMPLYFGEVPIIFWLLIKGAKAPEGGGPHTEPRAAG